MDGSFPRLVFLRSKYSVVPSASPCTWLILGRGQAAGHNKKHFGSSAAKALIWGLELHAGDGLGKYFDRQVCPRTT
jgi:hypothetical protein